MPQQPITTTTAFPKSSAFTYYPHSEWFYMISDKNNLLQRYNRTVSSNVCYLIVFTVYVNFLFHKLNHHSHILFLKYFTSTAIKMNKIFYRNWNKKTIIAVCFWFKFKYILKKILTVLIFLCCFFFLLVEFVTWYKLLYKLVMQSHVISSKKF